MKTKIALYSHRNTINCVGIMVIALLLTGCPTPEKRAENSGGVFFFQLNEEYKEYALVNRTDPTDPTVPSTSESQFYYIRNYPYRTANGAYFITDGSFRDRTFDICELTDEHIFYPLHKGYYTFFPFSNLGEGNWVSNVKWKDFCTASRDTMTVIGFCDLYYKNPRKIKIPTLESLTHKSRKDMTMDDIVRVINKLIDTNSIDKYCHVVYAGGSDGI